LFLFLLAYAIIVAAPPFGVDPAVLVIPLGIALVLGAGAGWRRDHPAAQSAGARMPGDVRGGRVRRDGARIDDVKGRRAARGALTARCRRRPGDRPRLRMNSRGGDATVGRLKASPGLSRLSDAPAAQGDRLLRPALWCGSRRAADRPACSWSATEGPYGIGKTTCSLTLRAGGDAPPGRPPGWRAQFELPEPAAASRASPARTRSPAAPARTQQVQAPVFVALAADLLDERARPLHGRVDQAYDDAPASALKHFNVTVRRQRARRAAGLISAAPSGAGDASARVDLLPGRSAATPSASSRAGHPAVRRRPTRSPQTARPLIFRRLRNIQRRS
jgi:hypothetical protein